MKFFIIATLIVYALNVQSQTVQDFTLANVTDGKNVSLNGFQNYRGIAVIFTSNECPFDIQYRERIRILSDQYKGSIQFLLINSHVEPKENANAMAQQFVSWNLTIPYLADKDQTAMGNLGAKKSPEVFLIKKNGNSNTVIYKGAIDDNPLVPADVDIFYLKIAIDQLLANKKIESPSNRTTGCSIRKKQL